MKPVIRRFALLCILAVFVVFGLYQFAGREPALQPARKASHTSGRIDHPVKWKDIPLRYPVSSMIPLPTGNPAVIPNIQHEFGVETLENKKKREMRLEAVKRTFLHSWKGYKKYAWMQDEVTPVSGGYKNEFGGRAVTLVDTLDTLSIMGLEKELSLALKALESIDFTTTDVPTVNVFETTIRYLGGLLSTYDLSGGKHTILLDKATDLGDMLYTAFDTPNRLPITRWDWENGALNGTQEASSLSLSAELGSLSLEFTRLSQLTGDPKYFDAVQRISDQFEKCQNTTSIPGLWPVRVNPQRENFNADRTFTFGGMSDSLYEYFPKQHMLLGGLVSQPRKLYISAIEAAKKYLFFRPLNLNNQDILLSGTAKKNAADFIKLQPEIQHLSCFTGGMLGIGAKIFSRPDDLDIARKLVNGCIWAYESMPSGIMPESFNVIPCPDPDDCVWSRQRWHEGILSGRTRGFSENAETVIEEGKLAPGFTEITDRRFLLRPEAIESVFILYRITGDTSLQDKAWRMFQAVNRSTKTSISNSAISDVTDEEPEHIDECESFWMAETLKYFYLTFSEPDVISLDEWVFNTEAHPLRRPQRE
ncbi:glycoside hydrolase family 47 protein [Lepidopterella palustris CBS 459.81]|uniref:alpha-1,2-Mannosidase n=1 Tax=Lepidopterella palustris CBS 459.81 TaxID=1314670 RepID=A0A8E2JI71_9PEZI|nr:glycoside hydrolase family 47 protein [Lepidopterella palustris CBS 459.81]